MLSLNRLAQLGMLWTNDPDKLGVAHERALALMDAFEMEGIYLNAAAIHLMFATAYVMGGNAERALDCLDDYERAVRCLEFPLELHGDAFFDKAQAWLEDVNIIGTSGPREDALVRKSLVESVSANPAFAALADEPQHRPAGAGRPSAGPALERGRAVVRGKRAAVDRLHRALGDVVPVVDAVRQHAEDEHRLRRGRVRGGVRRRSGEREEKEGKEEEEAGHGCVEKAQG